MVRLKSFMAAGGLRRLVRRHARWSLSLEFEFSGKLINAAFGKVFSHIANTMVGAFCKRANEVYRGN